MAPLTSNIPSDKRRPGVFQSFDDYSGARGMGAADRTIVVIGIKTSAGTQPVHTPVLAPESDVATLFGVGSEVDIMVKKVYETLRLLGAAAQVYAVAVAAPSGTAATRTFTVTGPATADGDLIVRIAGRQVRAAVKSGDSANTVAASLKAAIDAMAARLPCTAGVSTNVVTLTHRTTGVNGNDVAIAVDFAPAGLSVATASPVAGVGVASLTSALEALGSRDYLSVAAANHLAQDFTDFATHMTAMWAPARKRYRHGFFGENASLGTATTLAAGANRKDIVVGSYDGSPSLPCEIAAALAAAHQSWRGQVNYNYDGLELPLYPPADASVYDDTEVETAIAGGVTPITVTLEGKAKLERLVTTKATHNGATFENLRDVSVSSTQAHVARLVDAAIQIEIRGQNLDANLLKSLRGTAYRILKDQEEARNLHKVDEHLGELLSASHPSVPVRAQLEIPESVVPNAHQVDVTHRLFVEGA